MKYNHAFDFAFEIETNKEPPDVTGTELKAALLRRVHSMPDHEFTEACGCFDSYSNEEK